MWLFFISYTLAAALRKPSGVRGKSSLSFSLLSLAAASLMQGKHLSPGLYIESGVPHEQIRLAVATNRLICPPLYGSSVFKINNRVRKIKYLRQKRKAALLRPEGLSDEPVYAS